MKSNALGAAVSVATSHDDTLQTFLSLAADGSRDVPQYPATSHLQSFIKENVLTAPARNEKIEQFISFAGSLTGSFTQSAETPKDTYAEIISAIPKETAADARIRHAVDKVALELGLRACR